MLPPRLFRPVVSLFDAVLNGKRTRTSQQERDNREPPIATEAEVGAKEAKELRLHGRPNGMFANAARQHFLSQGKEWPLVVQHPETDTLEVPATVMGLIALAASWDGLMTDDEYASFRSVAEQVVPMGLVQQNRLQHHIHHHLLEEHLHMDPEEE